MLISSHFTLLLPRFFAFYTLKRRLFGFEDFEARYFVIFYFACARAALWRGCPALHSVRLRALFRHVHENSVFRFIRLFLPKRP